MVAGRNDKGLVRGEAGTDSQSCPHRRRQTMQPSTLTPLPRRASDRFVVLAGDAPAREAAAPTIRVLIAHGGALARAGLSALLEQQSDVCVTGEAADGEQAVALALSSRPDLVLM